MNLPTRIHSLTPGDVSSAVLIDLASPDPWDAEMFEQSMSRKNVNGIMARRRHVAVGFLVFEFTRTTLHVLNLAVAPLHRRQLVGTYLLNQALEKLAIQEASVDLRETNLAGQLFFRKMSFRWTQTVPRCWLQEDGYRMEWRVGGFEEEPIRQNRVANIFRRTRRRKGL